MARIDHAQVDDLGAGLAGAVVDGGVKGRLADETQSSPSPPLKPEAADRVVLRGRLWTPRGETTNGIADADTIIAAVKTAPKGGFHLLALTKEARSSERLRMLAVSRTRR